MQLEKDRHNQIAQNEDHSFQRQFIGKGLTVPGLPALQTLLYPGYHFPRSYPLSTNAKLI